MKAIVSLYKSEIVDYMKENDLKEDDVIMICSNTDFEKTKDKKKDITDVVLLSAPMGIPMNLDYLRFSLIGSETEPKPIAEQDITTTLKPKLPAAPIEKLPVVKEAVKEVEKPAPKKVVPQKKITPKTKK